MGLIYKYTSPSGKSYIGQTSRSPKERASDSFGHGYKHCEAFYNAIIKYGGLINFTLEIIEDNIPVNELDDKERYYISYYNTLAPQGYNLSPGGTQVADISKPVCQYNRKGEFLQEYKSAAEAAKAIGCSFTSISQVCHKKRVTAGGYKWSFKGELPSQKQPRQKIVYCFDDQGFLLHEFESVDSAANYYQVPRWQVYTCANKNHRKRVKDILIFTYDSFVDWNYYKLKHSKPQLNDYPKEEQVSSETEVLHSTIVDEDIV